MAHRVLSAFVAKIGSLDRAASYLRVDPMLLDAYVSGRRAIPDSILLKVMDALVVDAAKLPPAQGKD